MARIPQERPEAAELIRRIENSRSELEGHVRHLRKALDVPTRVKHSVSTHPIAWFGGSLGAGLFASRLFRRKTAKERKKRGFFGFLFATLLTLTKPALKGILLAELQRRFKVHTPGAKGPTETHLPLSKDQAPGSYS